MVLLQLSIIVCDTKQALGPIRASIPASVTFFRGARASRLRRNEHMTEENNGSAMLR